MHVIHPGKFTREFIHSVPDDDDVQPLMMRTIIMIMVIAEPNIT